MAEWLDAQGNYINFAINGFIKAVFFVLAFYLWDKVRFPFRWRKVLSVFLFLVGIYMFLERVISISRQGLACLEISGF